MSECEGISNAQFRSMRELLGISPNNLSKILSVNPRTIQSWEHGGTPIPPGVVAEVQNLATLARDKTTELVAEMKQRPAVQRLLILRSDEKRSVYRDDIETEELAALPPGWHRAVAARVADQVADVKIFYAGTNPSRWCIKNSLDDLNSWDRSKMYENTYSTSVEAVQNLPEKWQNRELCMSHLIAVDPGEWERYV